MLRDLSTELEKSGVTPCRRWHWNHHEDRQVDQVQKDIPDLMHVQVWS